MEIPLSSLPFEARAAVCKFLEVPDADADLVTLSAAAGPMTPTRVIGVTYDYETYLDGPVKRWLFGWVKTYRQALATVAPYRDDFHEFILLTPDPAVATDIIALARQKLLALELEQPSQRFLETGKIIDELVDGKLFPATRDGRYGKRVEVVPVADQEAVAL